VRRLEQSYKKQEQLMKNTEVDMKLGMERFGHWLKNASSDADLIKDLSEIEESLESAKKSSNTEKLKEIEKDLAERFACELEFGTGGLRGIMGAGTNRMNYYTVARAARGIADYVKASGKGDASVAVAHDSRLKSAYFARITAQVMAECGVKCYLFEELMPTPMLSYAVRRLSCDAGIVITASHNPSQYNGYKAYGRDGGQLSLEDSEAVITRVNKLDLFKDVKLADFDDAFNKGLIMSIGGYVIDDYFAEAKKQAIHKSVYADSGLKVVFTPLNGAGNKPVRRILKEVGITNVVVVREQELPDGNFPTCPSPNPEFKAALELGLKLCKTEKPDLLLATDPDCDRVGIAARNKNGEYELFTGNEVGAMLLEYICRERKAVNTLPLNPVTAKSIVTTAIADKIAKKYGVEMNDVLTGFKFIGEIVTGLERAGEVNRFLFAFEESIGYMAGSYVRDKDAVCTCMLICEMAAFYKRNGSSLVEARREMYEEHGCYYHYTQNIQFIGLEGKDKMSAIMSQLRKSCPQQINGTDVVSVYDYLKKTIVNLGSQSEPKPTGLPKSDVLKFVLADGSIAIVRPSGTEPKLKVYYTCIGETLEESVKLQEQVMEDFSKLLGI
jgi:phosphoglucomutase